MGFLGNMFRFERSKESPKENPMQLRDGDRLEHRWLANGETWTAIPEGNAFQGKTFMAALDALNPVIMGGQKLRFAIPFQHGCLVGTKVPDLNCEDPKAKHRHPTIIKVEFVDAQRFVKTGGQMGVFEDNERPEKKD